eukprot:scaffold164439_cov23-Tisochrysis_lutea.AAC.1
MAIPLNTVVTCAAAAHRRRSPWQVFADLKYLMRPQEEQRPLEEAMARFLERPVRAPGTEPQPWETTLVDLQRLYDSLIKRNIGRPAAPVAQSGQAGSWLA